MSNLKKLIQEYYITRLILTRINIKQPYLYDQQRLLHENSMIYHTSKD
ncbi:unnamed protein product [Aphis gossypii]|uniref:Uncharacterized protein n=1 Tax=Aphis gossypii TaxID=80765 RepID=A0A9P0JE87_APHGO|nr:unnamed protein product [Aphis gossypii]